MKCTRVVLLVLFLSVSLAAFSQSTLVSDSFNDLSDWMKVSGTWKVSSGRMVQTDLDRKSVV